MKSSTFKLQNFFQTLSFRLSPRNYRDMKFTETKRIFIFAENLSKSQNMQLLNFRNQLHSFFKNYMHQMILNRVNVHTWKPQVLSLENLHILQDAVNKVKSGLFKDYRKRSNVSGSAKSFP